MQPSTFFFQLGLLFAFLLGGERPLAAQASKDHAPAPVIAQNVSVRRGETVTISLGIHGVRGEQLEFLVRNQPKIGRLGKVTNVDFNAATVVYAAPADAAAGEDTFTYAARGLDGVSAPGVVRVTIISPPPAPPRLAVPNVVAFPDVLAGEKTSAVLEVSNRGGGMLEGEVKVSAPWSVEGDAKYRLGLSQKAEFTLLFHSDKIGTVTGEARLGPDPERAVRLTATVSAPFDAEPARLQMTAAPGSQTRRAVVKLTNRSEAPQTVKLSAGPRLIMDGAVVIPGKGTVEAPIFAEATPAGGFADKLQLSAGTWRQEVPVSVAALGPMLRLTKEVRSFGPAIAGQRAEAVVRLKNSGGTDAHVRLAVNAPFELARPDLVVAPGGDAEARVVAPGLAAGRYQATLRLEGEGLREQVPFVLQVAPKPAAPPAAVAARAARPVPALAGEAPESVVPVIQPLAKGEDRAPVTGLVGPRTRGEVPDSTGKFLASVEPEKAVLRWPAALGPTTQLSIERLYYSFGPDHEVKMLWLPLTGVVLHAESDPLTAEIPHLAPAQSYTVRVRSKDEAVFTVRFTTPKKQPWISFGWQSIVLTLLFLALGYLAFRLYRGRAQGGW